MRHIIWKTYLTGGIGWLLSLSSLAYNPQPSANNTDISISEQVSIAANDFLNSIGINSAIHVRGESPEQT